MIWWRSSERWVVCCQAESGQAEWRVEDLCWGLRTLENLFCKSLLKASFPRERERKKDDINWDRGHGALFTAPVSPLSCNISHLRCIPYNLLWHPNASWEGCRGGFIGAKHDASQNLTISAGISIRNNTVQCYNYTFRREGPSRRSNSFLLKCIFSSSEVIRRDEEERKQSC